MNLVPDWAPNIHPLLVHFPIALLCAAEGAKVVVNDPGVAADGSGRVDLLEVMRFFVRHHRRR